MTSTKLINKSAKGNTFTFEDAYNTSKVWKVTAKANGQMKVEQSVAGNSTGSTVMTATQAASTLSIETSELPTYSKREVFEQSEYSKCQEFVSVGLSNGLTFVTGSDYTENCGLIVNGNFLPCKLIMKCELGNFTVLTNDFNSLQVLADEVTA